MGFKCLFQIFFRIHQRPKQAPSQSRKIKYIHQTVSSSHDGDRSDAMVCNKLIVNLYILQISFEVGCFLVNILTTFIGK